MGARAFLFLCFSVLTAIIISALLRFLFPCVSQRRSGWKRATQLITNTMPRTLGPTGAPTKSWMYNFFYTLMAMTLAYLVMTLTVSKCCYRSVRRPVRILTPSFAFRQASTPSVHARSVAHCPCSGARSARPVFTPS